MSQTLTSTPAKITAFSDLPGNNSNLGGDLSIVPDIDNDRLKIKAFGSYLVMFNVSFSVTGAGVLKFTLYKNGAPSGDLYCKVTTGASGYYTANFMGVLSPSADDDSAVVDNFVVVELYGESDGSQVVAIESAQLHLVRL